MSFPRKWMVVMVASSFVKRFTKSVMSLVESSLYVNQAIWRQSCPIS